MPSALLQVLLGLQQHLPLDICMCPACSSLVLGHAKPEGMQRLSLAGSNAGKVVFESAMQSPTAEGLLCKAVHAAGRQCCGYC